MAGVSHDNDIWPGRGAQEKRQRQGVSSDDREEQGDPDLKKGTTGKVMGLTTTEGGVDGWMDGSAREIDWQ